MQWVVVRIKGTGQVQEMVPHVAEQLIAMGRAERVTPALNPSGPPVVNGVPTIEGAAIKPPQETATIGGVQFRVGPRSARPIAR